ncbi:MAG: DUF3604 domain-containing protein [Pseudomonadota bacterium]
MANFFTARIGTAFSRATLMFAILPLILSGVLGCDQRLMDAQQDENVGLAGVFRDSNELIPLDNSIIDRRPAPANPDRNAYFGDLHVHTANSFDAYSFGTTATPADAYRYAQGQALRHPVGFEVRLQQPLDFYAVTDHAMFMGLVKAADVDPRFSHYEMAELMRGINDPDNMNSSSLLQRGRAFTRFLPDILEGLLAGEIDPKVVSAISRSAWRSAVDAADAAYQPGVFTTFAAFEYTTSSNDRGNLHRNVIFRGTDRLPALPFSRLNSQNPEGLWDWMDRLRDDGIESLAIPHNSNGSNGQMFLLTDWAGNPMDDDYTSQRLRNEPLVEVSQVKGTSETHPLLSQNDEWANFEIAPYRVATKLYSEPAGGYVRDAYLRGLTLQAQGFINPYRFGLVGATDTHTGAAYPEENNYHSKTGMLDGTPERRGSVPASFLNGTIARFMDSNTLVGVEGRNYLEISSFEYWSASGLTGVWAEENTRDAIYNAFRRKETFATSGPRMKLRFFASPSLSESALDAPDVIRKAYDNGTPMGGELPAEQVSPLFIAWAKADSFSVPLQRLQIIKGWLENGEHREQVYDVACSDGLTVDPNTHRCPDNGASVDLSDCSTSAGVGAAELKVAWRDPDFRAEDSAFYYVRALENPTCRWSTWDAIRARVEPRPDLPATIQERAWSSPIWLNAPISDGAESSLPGR